MKILFAYYRYAPNANGPSTYIDMLRRELEREGHEVDLMSHDERWLRIGIDKSRGTNETGSNEAAPNETGAKESAAGESRQADKLAIKEMLDNRLRAAYAQRYSTWIYWRELERYSFEWAAMEMNLEAYDLIHCHDFMTARALFRVKPSHIPLVTSLHNCKYHESVITGEYAKKSGQEQQYIVAEERAGVLAGDAVIVPCEWLQAQFAGMGTARGGMYIVPYCIREEPATSHAPLLRERDTELTILCPARLVSVKGHRYLLEALRTLRRERADIRCLLAGDGSHLEELQRLTEQFGLQDCVSFLGKRNDIPALMAQSDIIVLPSLHDTFPLVVMEAQFSGKPVLATRVGGIVDMIEDGIDGLLVSPGDSAALVDRLRLLLGDSSLRQTLGQQALLKAVDRWGVDRHMAALMRIYNTLVSVNRPTQEATLPWQPDDELLAQVAADASLGNQSGYVLQVQVSGQHDEQLRQQVHYVHLLDLSGVVLQSREVDRRGQYVCDGVPQGTYVLKSTLQGFGNKVVELSG